MDQDTTTPRHHDTTTPRHHDTTTQRHNDTNRTWDTHVQPNEREGSRGADHAKRHRERERDSKGGEGKSVRNFSRISDEVRAERLVQPSPSLCTSYKVKEKKKGSHILTLTLTLTLTLSLNLTLTLTLSTSLASSRTRFMYSSKPLGLDWRGGWGLRWSEA
jgi:hypothetical protein